MAFNPATFVNSYSTAMILVQKTGVWLVLSVCGCFDGVHEVKIAFNPATFVNSYSTVMILVQKTGV